MSKDHLKTIAAAALIAIPFIVAVWAFMALLWWAIAGTDNNYYLCAAKAQSLNSTNWTTTGWRNDTCYIYNGKHLTAVKI